MEEEGRCTRPREIPRYHTSKSHHEAAREDSGWEDSKESRADGRRVECLHYERKICSTLHVVRTRSMQRTVNAVHMRNMQYTVYAVHMRNVQYVVNAVHTRNM